MAGTNDTFIGDFRYDREGRRIVRAVTEDTSLGLGVRAGMGVRASDGVEELVFEMPRMDALESSSPIARATKTAAYAMTTTDGTILANATTAAFTITLPPATVIGQRVVVRKIDSSANVVTVQRAGTDTIEGLTSITLPLQYDYIDVVLEETGKWYGR